MLKFSPANNKLKGLYLTSLPTIYKGYVYSFNLLAGYSCPFADKCLSKVVNGKIVDGPNTEFRCFSASIEATFPSSRKIREHNFNILKNKSMLEMFDLISNSMPDNLGICRIHDDGDFFNYNYMLAWSRIAIANPDKLFYAYTKSLPYWIRARYYFDSIPNFILTASYGGKHDNLIKHHKLRSVKVVYHPNETDLIIDHDDSNAADPQLRNKDFALLIHGKQKPGSHASIAIKKLKREGIKFSYGKL